MTIFFFKEIRRYKFVTYRRKRRDYKVVITYWAIKAVYNVTYLYIYIYILQQDCLWFWRILLYSPISFRPFFFPVLNGRYMLLFLFWVSHVQLLHRLLPPMYVHNNIRMKHYKFTATNDFTLAALLLQLVLRINIGPSLAVYTLILSSASWITSNRVFLNSFISQTKD